MWMRCRITQYRLGLRTAFLHTKFQPKEAPELTIPFDNVTLRELPVENNQSSLHRQVKGACFTRLPPPEPLPNPTLVAHSKDVIQKLHLSEVSISHPDFVQYFSGNKLFPGSEPAAHCYCGFQYGLFSGQLGDGAVMYLGDVVGADGQKYEVQLKGSGKTPFSRASTDGRKVLRSSIREMLASEAMAHLGIPTSRVATCITSDLDVHRDIMYSGDLSTEKATVICRIAPTFLRVGSLEVVKEADSTTGKQGPSAGNLDLLKSILHHLISTHYSHLYSHIHLDPGKVYLTWFKELVSQSGKLLAHWQAVGFCHGVLNTDNISLVGTTMDYGPYGFLDVYDPNFVCNASDYWARYSFIRQPKMMEWALVKLSEILEPLVDKQALKRVLQDFDTVFHSSLQAIMHKKLGLNLNLPGDRFLIDELLTAMQKTGSDYNKTFRCLSNLHSPRCADFQTSLMLTKQAVLRQCCSLKHLKNIYSIRPYPSQEEIVRSLWVLQSNPELLPKFVEMSQAATDQLNSRTMVTHVQNMSRNEKMNRDEVLWDDWLFKYSERLLLESERNTFSEEADMDRRIDMDKHNPRFTLRNHILQKVIGTAENKNFEPIRVLLELIQNPYDDFPHKGCGNDELASELIDLHDDSLPETRIRVT